MSPYIWPINDTTTSNQHDMETTTTPRPNTTPEFATWLRDRLNSLKNGEQIADQPWWWNLCWHMMQVVDRDVQTLRAFTDAMLQNPEYALRHDLERVQSATQRLRYYMREVDGMTEKTFQGLTDDGKQAGLAQVVRDLFRDVASGNNEMGYGAETMAPVNAAKRSLIKLIIGEPLVGAHVQEIRKLTTFGW